MNTKVCIIYLQSDGLPQPLNQGGCTVHTGRTLHYTNGNKTNRPRRAYIVNYRKVMGRSLFPKITLFSDFTFSLKRPNEFALKAGIEKLNEIRLLEGETQESIMI